MYAAINSSIGQGFKWIWNVIFHLSFYNLIFLWKIMLCHLSLVTHLVGVPLTPRRSFTTFQSLYCYGWTDTSGQRATVPLIFVFLNLLSWKGICNTLSAFQELHIYCLTEFYIRSPKWVLQSSFITLLRRQGWVTEETFVYVFVKQ